jgi:uncharacterized protein (TIGR03905 family)
METRSVNYRTQWVCCTRIRYELREGRLFNVRFTGGCHGNARGLASLLEGMQAAEARKRLSGITCDSKPTSRPDQLARSLKSSSGVVSAVWHACGRFPAFVPLAQHKAFW